MAMSGHGHQALSVASPAPSTCTTSGYGTTPGGPYTPATPMNPYEQEP